MNTTSPHILSTSANLLGFTFIVYSTIRGLHMADASYIDETLAVCIVILALSSLLSFVSIRSKPTSLSRRYETVAEYIFLVALILISMISVLLAANVKNFSF